MPEASMQGSPRCRRCGDVIGVYEPMVVVAEGRAHVTSRAAERGGPPAGDWYHEDCYTADGDDPRAPATGYP
jgi:hypothetical protein